MATQKNNTSSTPAPKNTATLALQLQATGLIAAPLAPAAPPIPNDPRQIVPCSACGHDMVLREGFFLPIKMMEEKGLKGEEDLAAHVKHEDCIRTIYGKSSIKVFDFQHTKLDLLKRIEQRRQEAAYAVAHPWLTEKHKCSVAGCPNPQKVWGLEEMRTYGFARLNAVGKDGVVGVTEVLLNLICPDCAQRMNKDVHACG